MTGRRILIVDDDAFIRRPLEVLLRRAGYDTELAVDGESCLAAMERNPPDLVCLDIMMPNRDGFSTLEEIKKRSNLRRIPIILLSAKGQDGDVARGRALGATYYVPKPYSPRDLLAKINAALSAKSTIGGNE